MEFILVALVLGGGLLLALWLRVNELKSKVGFLEKKLRELGLADRAQELSQERTLGHFKDTTAVPDTKTAPSLEAPAASVATNPISDPGFDPRSPGSAKTETDWKPAPGWSPATIVYRAAKSSEPAPIWKAAEPPTYRRAIPPTRVDNASPAPPATRSEGSFISLLKGNLFAVAGIALLLLGFAWLLHSIQWGHLIPPLGRLALVWVAAAGLGALGTRLGAKNFLWGQVVQGGAAAVAYLATYIGGTNYGILPAPWTFAIFAGISAILVTRAFKENSKVLAGVGFIGAYIAPILAMYEASALDFNLTYGLIVSAFALWTSSKKRWIELGVHAHGCAAILAWLTYAQHLPALTPWAQQLLLVSYLVLFSSWSVLWDRRRPLQKEASVLAACLATAVLTYLGLEHWLLTPAGFTGAGLWLAVVLAGLATLEIQSPVLRDTTFILGAFSSLFALQGGGLSYVFTGALGLVEGITLTLTCSPRSVIRRGVAWIFVFTGLVALLYTQNHVAILFALVAVYGMSLLTSKTKIEDSLIFAVSSFMAAIDLCEVYSLEYSRFAAALLMLAVGMLAGMLNFTQVRRITRLYLVFAILCWLHVLLTPPGSHAWMHVLTLGGTLVLGVSMYRAMWNVVGPNEWVRAGGLQWLGFMSLALFLMPAVFGEKLGASTLVVIETLILGICAYAWCEGWGKIQALWGLPHTAQYPTNAGNVSLGAGVIGLFAFVGWLTTGALFGTLVNLLAGLTALLALGTWAVFEQGTALAVRRVLALSGAILIGYLWVVGMSYGPTGALALAWNSALLPLLLAAAGVLSVWVSSKAGAREAWGLAAVVCVIAMLKLLLSLGSAVLSPLGIAASLIGMGALFLIAGYLAPRPANTEKRQILPSWLPLQRKADAGIVVIFTLVFACLAVLLWMLVTARMNADVPNTAHYFLAFPH